MGARLIEVQGRIQSSPDKVVHLVAERLFDRSHDLMNLANDALGRKHMIPPGAALIEPLQEELRLQPDSPVHKIRHPRNVRILPRSRDFH
jgi:error-prone DNA polymerase